LPSRCLRAGYRIGLAAAVIFIGCESLQNAVANGDTRTISMHHVHTGESLTITYKRDGRYDEDALKKLNWLLRDWRRNEDIRMDPQLIDLVWDASREVGATKPIEIICGYRAPATNKMLRSRSSGVAESSQHMLGHAMDFYIPGVPLEKLREVGLRFQRGGVGFYPTSGSPFVHMDVGSVRHWPRMTHDQLVRVFPNGRTVHVPSDGRPLPGYALALADIERRGQHPNGVSLAAARRAGVNVAAVESAAPRGNVLASLFGLDKSDTGKSDNNDTSSNSTVSAQAALPGTVALPRAKSTTTLAALPATSPAASTEVAERVPLPRSRPSYQFASASQDSGSTRNSTTPFEVASALPMETGLAPRDRDNMTLAYAPVPAAEPVERLTAVEAAPDARFVRLPRSAPGFVRNSAPVPGTRPSFAPVTTASIAPSTVMTSSFVNATTQVGKAGQSYEDPWLRAAILTPSMTNYMSVSSLSEADPHGLVAFMGKPTTILAMSFSRDPRQGLATQAFTGNAVTFVATLPQTARTASLY
jgi:uncharacterized protein YcbK (DUF882 family)